MVRAPPGTCVPDPGIPSKKRAEAAIHPVAQEATRAQNSATPGLMGARMAPARPASVATGTAGSAATLAAIPHTGTDPDRDTTSGAVANSARAGTHTISVSRRRTRPMRVSPRIRRFVLLVMAAAGPTTARAASAESANP